MKKQFSLLVSLFMIFGSFALVGCDTKPTEHVHTFSKTYSMDENEHWFAATCEHKDEVKDKAPHNFVNDVCDVCGYEKTIEDEHHFSSEYSYDGTYHYFACLDIGCAARKDVEECSGGTATCVDFAVCDVCGHPHGDLDLDNHDLEHHQGQEPTCVNAGWEEYDTCKREGCSYTTYKEKPATGTRTYVDGVCECGQKSLVLT